MEGSYTISRNTAALVAVVLIVLVVLALLAGRRHMDWMKQHCDSDSSPSPGYASQQA